MAEDWIKMRMGLTNHPKTVRISSALSTDKFRTVGGLHAVWCVFDTYSEDGFLEGYTLATLGDAIGWPGFAEAMAAVEWLTVTPKGITAPRFETHNGESAKRRAHDAERKRVQRMSPDNRDKSGTKSGLEKEKEKEKEKDKGTTFVAPDWLPSEVWSMWHNYRNARKGWTIDAKRLSASKLEKLTNKNPELAKQIIERSIENSYAGLFPLDGTKNAPAPRARKQL